jgi:PadR family transcriptional regulator
MYATGAMIFAQFTEPLGIAPLLVATDIVIVREQAFKDKKAKIALDRHCSARHNTAMLNKELVAASTVPLVLSVLTEGENYGYALIQRVRELSGGKIEWTEGMLYPVLHWMEKEDLIESEWREAETGRKRKYYRLRKEGRKALQTEKQQWMTVHEALANLWKTCPSST